ncbi:MAG: hypothetical protein J6B27_01370, partial [Alistipes sp.]|nr:hypothetical protein [Alistipes sp.]
GDGDIFNGGGMEDLTLVLVNSMGYISEIQQILSLTGEEQRIKSVTFVNLDVGNYMLYAYANTERSLLSEVRDMLATLEVGDSFDSSRYDALFTALTNRETPTLDSTNPLLLTASKALSVGVENSSTTIDMLRPIVWFEVRLFNHSDYPMQVDDVSFSNFNPSTSYILSKDGAIPSSVTYRGLPLYTTYSGGEDVVVPAATESCIYETALFENRAPSYTMSLTLKVGSTQLVTATSISTSSTYALKNRATGNYLVDDGSGRMAMVSSIDKALSADHAMWRFSATRNGYLTNVATGNRFYRSTTAATSGSNLTFTFSNSYLRIYYSTRYYLHDNNGSPSFANITTQNRDWILQKMESTQQTASINNSQINIIDMATAAVTPMTEQLRNQHIKVVINAYYNEIDGQFNFVVLPWTEKNEEVEFN